jgi:arylsulfatase A
MKSRVGASVQNPGPLPTAHELGTLEGWTMVFKKKIVPVTIFMLFVCFGCRQTTREQKLNVILINVDDLGWTDLACYGSGYYETPNIDRLADQGMRFTNAYAAAAVCSPTRAAIMTGRYPARLGITDWIHHLDREAEEALEAGRNPTEYVGGAERCLLCPPNAFWMELDEITIAEMLRPAGYVTGHVGKWHLGHEAWFPDKQGFDFNAGGTEIGQPPSYFDPYHLNERRPNIATLPPRQEGEYLTDRESDEAIGFIRENADKPFFLNMCHYAVHTPLEAREEMVARYEAKPKTNQTNAVYAAMIESVDDAVGRLMETLDELRLSDRTIVLFTSDNGGLLGHSTDNAPLCSGKGYPYEGGIRVPLIVRWPGVVEASTLNDTPVSSIDFFPTISEAAGVALPSGPVIDGVSLVPVLKQTGSLNRDALYWHFPHYREPDIPPYSIIRRGDWKLIKRYEGPAFELYNLADDIGETNDLYETMPEKVEELEADLTAWLEETGAKLPRTNPEYE